LSVANTPILRDKRRAVFYGLKKALNGDGQW